MSELRACPFCGKDEIENSTYDRIIYCGNCGAQIDYGVIKDGIRDWNTRPLEDALIAERDALEKERDEFHHLLNVATVERDALNAKLEAAKEALNCGLYALLHPESDQNFAHNAIEDALKQLEAE